MRVVAATDITSMVAELYQEANYVLPADIVSVLLEASGREQSALGREVLEALLKNAEIAARDRIPLCQDTGIAVVFIELGREVMVSGGALADAVNKGIALAQREGYLRASVVADPCFERRNTGDNTPAVIHVEAVEGEVFRVSVLPKGAGSENMGAIAMLDPADASEGLVRFAVETVSQSGAKACPPLFLGIGVGGTMDKAASLAKKVLLRPAGTPNSDARLAQLESEVKDRVNDLGIGPGGFGGTITCLGVAIEDYPCHIASLPVAVNIQCNAARSASRSL